MVNNFTLTIGFFGVTCAEKSDKNKYLYSSCGIAFDGASSWRFGDGFARTVVIFSVDNSLSSYADNIENNFLVID